SELGELRELLERIARQEQPWLRPVHFSGPEGIFRRRDDRGPSAVSYGIYNPVAAGVYLGLFGASPSRAGGGFPVPAESALIVPLDVPAQLEIGIDEAELGAGNTATIYVMRFQTVQPFFLGKI
ncbi:MAG TPA: hypothetical protein VNY83_04965, partial [Solirubrobacterales bacterium]|nr:hypothetical protein [Solirubrobacterales bacterium]